MNKVSLLKCDSYEITELKKVILQSLENINFDLSTLNNARVIVKPNLLMPAKAEKAIITHHDFYRTIVQIVKENGGTPVLLESPAIHSLKRVINKTDYKEMLEAENVEVADPAPVQTLNYQDAKSFRKIDISKEYFNADIIFNVPKFKTHGITYVTGAVKLLFGVIPGLAKSKMHFKLPTHTDFSDFLLDLYGAVTYGFSPQKPVIHIMDAILAMEGEGPGPGGKAKIMGAVLAGKNGVAIDYIATKVAGLDHQKSFTITEGFNRNFGVNSPDEIDVIGNTVEEMKLVDFEPASGNSILSNAYRWPLNTKTFRNLIVERPVPQKDKCTSCYQCKKICPAGVIEVAGEGKLPKYNYRECIRCYCCLEICPEAAITKKKGKLQWFLPGRSA